MVTVPMLNPAPVIMLLASPTVLPMRSGTVINASPAPPPAVAAGKTCDGKEPGPPIVAPAAAKAGAVVAPAAAG
ncbi:MAG: hypothetical protein ACREIR_17520, partial [Geminicoccaceae bacterium]